LKSWIPKHIVQLSTYADFTNSRGQAPSQHKCMRARAFPRRRRRPRAWGCAPSPSRPHSQQGETRAEESHRMRNFDPQSWLELTCQYVMVGESHSSCSTVSKGCLPSTHSSPRGKGPERDHALWVAGRMSDHLTTLGFICTDDKPI